LLFDFDGTIADSIRLGIRIANNIAPKFGYEPFSEKDLKRFQSLTWRNIISELHLPLYKIPKLISIGLSEYRHLISEVEPCEGILEMLNNLSERGIPMALLSSNTDENVKLFLDKYNIDTFKWVEGTAGTLHKAKHIKYQLRKHKLKPHKVIYVGDEIRDIQAAHKCAMKIISVTWGFHSPEFLLHYNPDFLVNNPNEIVELIDTFIQDDLAIPFNKINKKKEERA